MSPTHETDVRNTIKALFRAGNPAARDKPARLARVRNDGGWFGGTGRAPDVDIDTKVIDEPELSVYVAALERNGFFGPDSWYMNHELNTKFAAKARDRGRVEVNAALACWVARRFPELWAVDSLATAR